MFSRCILTVILNVHHFAVLHKLHALKRETVMHRVRHLPNALLWISMSLCVESSKDPSECSEVTYLQVGKEGMINCSFDSFFAVSWYTKEDYDEENLPLIYLNGGKDGLVDQYDAYPNGSFVFRNVSIHDAGSYTVTLLKELRGNLFVRDVHLRVYVIPDPKYPVVEGYVSQQHVYMDVSRNGELSCSVRGVYPNISLVWTVIDRSQMGKIHFHQDVVGRRINNDGTYDITLTSLYDVTDQSVRRITIQCGVADEMGEVLASKTKVELLFSSVYPVVNGHINQKHVNLDAEREGHLICIKENVAAGTTLAWKIVDPNMQEKIAFQSNTIVLDNDDGTVTINQTFDYEIIDHSLDRITIECEVTFLNSDENSLTTKVDLLFPNVYPVVNGQINQKHVYLDAEREGHLICIKESVAAGTTLAWKIVDPNMQEKIAFQSNAIVFDNNDGTVKINQTFDYEIIDNSLDRITIECEVTTADSDGSSLATKVDLFFQSAPVPVIDGCYSKQNMCVLRMQKQGDLACSVMNSQQQVELRWRCDDDLFMLKERKTVIKNDSGLYNVFSFASYDIHDQTIDWVSIHCEAIGWRGETPPDANVFLNFEKVEPGLELKVNYVLALVVLQNFLLICPVIFVVARMGRRRKCEEKVKIFIRSNSNVMETPVSQDIEQGAANGKPETISLLSTSQNTAGPISSDSGKGSGSDRGSDENDKAHFSDGGKLIVAAEDNGEIRRAENHNLTKTILRTFQLLFDKYLSREHEIEETVALINEEEKKEEELD